MKMRRSIVLRARTPARPLRVLGDGYSDDLQLRKKWYSTRRWKKIRAAHLASSPWCVRCAREGIRTAARVVDHVQGHIDASWRERFWSGPFMSLCTNCHNAKTGRETQARRRAAGGGVR
jgi:5-methylcytosine-specific restriction endonuclease McrA